MAKKRMYKKGSFLEPNKELKFGGLKKKSKYQRGGSTRTNEEDARAGTPRAETAAKAKANNSSNVKRVLPPSINTRSSTAMSVLDQSEFRSGKGAAASPNKTSSIAKIAGAESAAKPKTTSGTSGVGRPINQGTKKPTAKSTTKPKAAESKAAEKTPAATKPASSEPKPGTYAYAKKRNPNLDKLIAERKKYAKGSDDYNRVQNQINKAYGSGPMRKEATTYIKTPAPKTVPTSAPKKELAVKKPAPKQTPSGGSGMGAVAKESAVKKELQSAKPVDRRASASKPTSKKMDRLVKKVKKEDAKMRRKNTTATPEGRRPKAQARRLNRASNASAGVKKMGDNYGSKAMKASRMKKMGDAVENALSKRVGMKMGGKYMKKGGFPDLNKDGKITFADVLKGRLKKNKNK